MKVLSIYDPYSITDTYSVNNIQEDWKNKISVTNVYFQREIFIYNNVQSLMILYRETNCTEKKKLWDTHSWVIKQAWQETSVAWWFCYEQLLVITYDPKTNRNQNWLFIDNVHKPMWPNRHHKIYLFHNYYQNVPVLGNTKWILTFLKETT